jgi:catechol 2,3-dioxygenase-like lactoylglutathione lyase family enzyme
MMPSSIIDHVDIRVSDVDLSGAFYEAALAPLGIRPDPERPDPAGGREIGFRSTGGNSFSIHSPTSEPGQDTITTGAHIAFVAATAAAVQAFHAAALRAGGRNIGDPGPRSEYSKGYYGAFVLDPDGNNVEAVAYEE